MVFDHLGRDGDEVLALPVLDQPCRGSGSGVSILGLEFGVLGFGFWVLIFGAWVLGFGV